MKKSLITILCLLCFASVVSAELYQQPGSYKETITEVTVTPDNSTTVSETKTKFKRRKLFRFRDNNPTNTYWNFGRPPFWTGTI